MALQRTAATLGSRTVRIICRRLLQPTGHFRRRSLSLGRWAQCCAVRQLEFLFRCSAALPSAGSTILFRLGCLMQDHIARSKTVGGIVR